MRQMPGIVVQGGDDSPYIHPFMLSRWRKQERNKTIVTTGVMVCKRNQAEFKALRRVKKSCAQLTLEHGFPKSTVSLQNPSRRLRLHADPVRRSGDKALTSLWGLRQKILAVAGAR